MNIFPPNILGQSIFALSESRREHWYLKYLQMWVLDTHSSHKIMMQGYLVKSGTTSRGDMTGAISLMVDIIAGGAFVTWPNHFFPDHVEAERPCARVAVALNQCRGWGCASSARRSVQGRVSQRVHGGCSLYQSPRWWVAGMGGRGLPTSGREVSRFLDRRALCAFVFRGIV